MNPTRYLLFATILMKVITEVPQASFMQQYPEARLLLLARSGDKEAFGDLMTHYQPMALHLATRIVGNRENAYELVQEAMLQAYGIGLMGQGQIWLDHLTFETVGPELAVTTRS